MDCSGSVQAQLLQPQGGRLLLRSSPRRVPLPREALRWHGRDADRIRHCLPQQATPPAPFRPHPSAEAHHQLLGCGSEEEVCSAPSPRTAQQRRFLLCEMHLTTRTSRGLSIPLSLLSSSRHTPTSLPLLHPDHTPTTQPKQHHPNHTERTKPPQPTPPKPYRPHHPNHTTPHIASHRITTPLYRLSRFHSSRPIPHPTSLTTHISSQLYSSPAPSPHASPHTPRSPLPPYPSPHTPPLTAIPAHP